MTIQFVLNITSMTMENVVIVVIVPGGAAVEFFRPFAPKSNPQ